MEYPRKTFVEIRGNIKHDLTGIVYERGTGNSNYNLDQIIEAINRLSRRMETLLQRAKTATHTGNSKNNNDPRVNETLDYHDEGEGVDIYDEDTTEEIISIIDRRNNERVSEMAKKRNIKVGYYEGQLQKIPLLLQFTKTMCKQLIENPFIGNERDNIALAILYHPSVLVSTAKTLQRLWTKSTPVKDPTILLFGDTSLQTVKMLAVVDTGGVRRVKN